MPLSLDITRLPDPDGHNPALLLKGDWVLVQISDGEHVGYGEASHSKDDDACRKAIETLFHQHIAAMELTPENLIAMDSTVFSGADSFVQATAISGLNQALCDLLARQTGRAVWELFAEEKAQERVPVYATINRALTTRTEDDYRRIASTALGQGFTAIKCAPFEKVEPGSRQVEQSQYGLSILQMLREEFGHLSLRVDLHERFTLESFREILPELQRLDLEWIEAPIPIDARYRELRAETDVQLALGELYYGVQGFQEIVEGNWADVIMPDVKHVGGFTRLVEVIRSFSDRVEISPHNPSGPVASLAAMQAAAISPRVTSLEIPLIVDPARAYYRPWLASGHFAIPDQTVGIHTRIAPGCRFAHAK